MYSEEVDGYLAERVLFLITMFSQRETNFRICFAVALRRDIAPRFEVKRLDTSMFRPHGHATLD